MLFKLYRCQKLHVLPSGAYSMLILPISELKITLQLFSFPALPWSNSVMQEFIHEPLTCPQTNSQLYQDD